MNALHLHFEFTPPNNVATLILVTGEAGGGKVGACRFMSGEALTSSQSDQLWFIPHLNSVV